MRRFTATAVTTAVAILSLPSVVAAHGGHPVPAGMPQAAHLHLGDDLLIHGGIGLLVALTLIAGAAYLVRTRLARHGRRR